MVALLLVQYTPTKNTCIGLVAPLVDVLEPKNDDLIVLAQQIVTKLVLSLISTLKLIDHLKEKKMKIQERREK
jgi:hypothetical protein